jgi:tetratricopeptide (TPR) repeat protein
VTVPVRWASFFFFGLATIAAIRLVVADTFAREETEGATRRAIALEWPFPSAELEQMLAEADPEHAREALTRAVKANPQSSASWIALGLLEETNGAASEAERSLLQAAKVDRQYLPAWTLANFYFRRASRDQFWVWADRAAALTYDDLRPLIRLADQFEPDPGRMLAHFRDARRVRPSYLDFLIGKKRLEEAQQVARAMADDRANDPRLIDLADRQLRAGNVQQAIELWNIASGFPGIDPPAGTILTNGDLSRAPLNLGFDWRVGQAEGLLQRWKPSELMFTLTGSQPEACALLEQTVYLPSGHFQLRFKYLTDDGLTKGVRWSLDNIEGPPIEPGSQWTEGVFDFPSAKGLRNLKLFYRREPGTTRAEGRIEIRGLRLDGPL